MRVREAGDIAIQFGPQFLNVSRGLGDKVPEIVFFRISLANSFERQLKTVLIARNLTAGLDHVAGFERLGALDLPHTALNLSRAIAQCHCKVEFAVFLAAQLLYS